MNMHEIRTGYGYDVHPLREGRPLIIGGVQIEFSKGLAGHSDADVLLHAIIDALLGAAGLNDIGYQFPDSDPAYKDADSRKLLREVRKLIEKHQFTINNVDATLIAEAPKIQPYIARIKDHIASDLQIASDRISVKATTSEGLGFIGIQEGMAAMSVATLFHR